MCGAQTCKRKNLQGLSKDDIISLALTVWHQPCMRANVPEELVVGMRVSHENQSRSILLNVMQRGITPAGHFGQGQGAVGVRDANSTRLSFQELEFAAAAQPGVSPGLPLKDTEAGPHAAGPGASSGTTWPMR